MNPTNKVPFSPAGKGAFLRYRTADYVELRKLYGEPKRVTRPNPATGFPEEVWETFTTRIDDALVALDPIVIIECLKHGLKQEDGVTAFDGVDFSDMHFSLMASVRPIQEALVLALTNQPYSVLLAAQREKDEQNERLRKAGVEFNDDVDPDPSTAPMMPASSDESSGSAIPQDS